MKEYHNVIPGFVPAAENQYYCTSVGDLRENCWEPCEFRFRGFVPEIEKLRRYLKENGMENYTEISVSDQIQELRVIAGKKTMDLIEEFPALKVTGLAENWSVQQVCAVFSESGFNGITHIQDVGFFDPRHEGGSGRWEWEYDMMERVNVSFIWLQTGDEEEFIIDTPSAANGNEITMYGKWTVLFLSLSRRMVLTLKTVSFVLIMVPAVMLLSRIL